MANLFRRTVSGHAPVGAGACVSPAAAAYRRLTRR